MKIVSSSKQCQYRKGENVLVNSKCSKCLPPVFTYSLSVLQNFVSLRKTNFNPLRIGKAFVEFHNVTRLGICFVFVLMRRRVDICCEEVVWWTLTLLSTTPPVCRNHWPTDKSSVDLQSHTSVTLTVTTTGCLCRSVIKTF